MPLPELDPSKTSAGTDTQVAAPESKTQTTSVTEQSTQMPNPDAENPKGFEDQEPADEQPSMFRQFKSDDDEAAALNGVTLESFRTGRKEVPAGATKPVVPAQTQTPGKPKARTFEGLEGDEVAMFKSMSNAAYEKLYPLYLEHRKIKPEFESASSRLKEVEGQLEQVKGKVPPSLFNHPKGYLLSQKYEQLQSTVGAAQFIKNHWDTQMAKIRRGEKFQSMDIVDGKVVYSEPKEATTEDEIAILQNAQETAVQLMEARRNLTSHVEEFQQSFSKDAAFIKTEEEKHFPGYDKPDHPTFKMQKAVLEALPPTYREHPLASLVSKITSALVMNNQRIQQLQKELEIAKGIKRDIQSPTASSFAAGGGAPKTPFNGITLDKFRDRG